jgi:Leucine-rich repeat (LRR) protein
VIGEIFYFIHRFKQIFEIFFLASTRHFCESTELISTTPDTRITSITGNLDYPFLSDVQSLGISDTKMAFIPDFTLVTRQFQKFNELIIIHSGLKSVDRRQLSKIPQLKLLILAENLIEHLPEDVLSDLVNLEALDVSRNEIKVLPPKLLWNLPKLNEFSANGNRIEVIPRDFFKNNRELEKLWINDNKITRIEVDFTLLPKLKGLDLDGNTCISERGSCYQCEIGMLREIQQKINPNCAGIA